MPTGTSMVVSTMPATRSWRSHERRYACRVSRPGNQCVHRAALWCAAASEGGACIVNPAWRLSIGKRSQDKQNRDAALHGMPHVVQPMCTLLREIRIGEQQGRPAHAQCLTVVLLICV